MITKSEIDTLKQVKRFIREPYAWPGAYSQALVMSDGGCLCSKCAKQEWKLICAESFDNSNCGFRASGVSVNWENNDLFCDHCYEQIPSAYGER